MKAKAKLDFNAAIALDRALNAQAGTSPTEPMTSQAIAVAKDSAPMAYDLTRFVLWMKSDPVRWEKFIFVQDQKFAEAALEYTGE